MMRQLFAFFLALTASCLASISVAQDTSIAISERLVNDGFENVRVARWGNHISVMLEDNHYRGIYYGLTQALKIISPSTEASDTIELIAMEDQIPRMTINATHVNGSWTVDTQYGATISNRLRNAKVSNRSAFKLDIIPYPSFVFSNHRFDRLWSFALYLSPTMEMNLWPGSKVTAQVKVLAYDNFKDAEFYDVMPGYITLHQQILATKKWDVSSTLGVFNLYRTGLDVRAMYHVNNRLDIGVIAGATGPWYFQNDKITLCYWDKVSAMACINYYEPHTNLQIDLKAGQFVFEDRGFRLDVLRHMKDYAVGVYVDRTTTNGNLGFEFSVPIGPKKMGKHRAMRVRLPETVSLRMSENFTQDAEENYSADQMEQLCKINPDDNYSAHYWQPELLKELIQLCLEGVIE